jgi:hypothetical protein
MIYHDGSKVVALKPGADDNSFVEEVRVEDEDDNLDERTPRQRNVKKHMADTSHDDDPEGPYKTPVVLRTKPWAPSVMPDDTEADDSEIERIVSKLRKRKVTKVSSGDNLNTLIIDVVVFCSIFRNNKPSKRLPSKGLVT